MSFFDTHAHFTQLDGPDGFLQSRERAVARGVCQILVVGGNSELNQGVLACLRCKYAGVYGALGLDRDQAAVAGRLPDGHAGRLDRLRAACLETVAAGLPLVAIGEMGLDYHYAHDTAVAQRALFAAELRLAASLRLPVIVHSREAEDDTLLLLEQYVLDLPHALQQRPGVLHCFTGGPEFAAKLVALGFYISFSGIVTFRNAERLRQAVSVIPADRLLIETDTPYLAPVPHRGKRNEPAFVCDVAQCLAGLCEVPVAELALQTCANAAVLFGLQDASPAKLW